MKQPKKGDGPDDDAEGIAEGIAGDGQSVIEFLQSRTGDAPRVTLRDEDSAAASSPIIDPRSAEKTSVPRGRSTYQLMGEIARGGMGVILKGHDTDLGRDVAVKVLDERLAKRAEVVQRFVEEAQIGGQLQHPGIVPVYELGLLADERPYFTMKLIKGRTLATLLSERESPGKDRRRLIDIFESICQTMAYAHSRGVIHRDLKPANVMVGAFGEVQVVDWGLAKVLARGGTADEKRARELHSNLTILETVRSDGSGSGSESMVGSILGTPAYMPPEQASGLVDRLDERADVFALGAILCEILTGLPPYVGEREEVIAAAAQAEYDDALERLDRCGAHAELVKLTKQCLMAAAAARPTNAGVVAERVHEHLASVEERAQAAQVEAAAARVRAEQERKARKLTLALGVAVAAILVVAGVGWVAFQNERAAQERESARRETQVARADAQREAELARVDAERQAAEAKRVSALTAEVNVALAEAARLEGAEDWAAAATAAARARALAEGGGAGAELLAGIEESIARIAGGREAERVVQQQALDTQKLLAEVRTALEPDWASAQSDALGSALARSTAVEEAFLAHGIDILGSAPEDSARRLAERRVDSEIALLLDGWAGVLRTATDDPGAERALRVAQLVDPDPLRSDLRAAFAKQETEVLLWIADNDLETQPPETIELLAYALDQLEENEKALEVMRRGVRIHPGAYSLNVRLARALVPGFLEFLGTDETHEGVGYLRSALAVRPASDLVRFRLGRAYGKLGLYDKALAQFEVLHDRTPQDWQFRFHYAWELVNTGKHERAMPFLLELVDEPYSNWLQPWCRYLIGRVLQARGDLAGAISRVEEAIAEFSGNPAWHDTLFELYLAQSEDLEESAARALERFGRNALLLNNLAWKLIVEVPRDEVFPIALALAEASIDVEQNAAYWNTLGAARFYTGDFEGAVRACQESIAAGGWTVSDALFLAMAHHRLGNTSVADDWYAQALREFASSPQEPVDIRFREEARRIFGR